MLHDIFGEIKFNVGWKTQDHINLFGKEYNITLKLQDYFEKDGITKQQEKAYIEYSESKKSKAQVIEKLLKDYSDTAETQYLPKTLLINRDGSYALLCDDKNDPDGGIAVCLSPKKMIMIQDDYL